MAIHTTLTGALDAIERHLDRVPTNIAEHVKSESEEVTPVRTGHLKASYVIEGDRSFGGELVVGNTAHYAEYVEFGTEKFGPRAMMKQGSSKVHSDGNRYL